MTAPNLEQPDDADIDASLALDGFDASDRYPEYGHSALRAAYRSGWADVVAAIRDSGYTVIALPEAEKQAEFIQDIATHGIGADLNPTRRWDGDQDAGSGWSITVERTGAVY